MAKWRLARRVVRRAEAASGASRGHSLLSSDAISRWQAWRRTSAVVGGARCVGRCGAARRGPEGRILVRDYARARAISLSFLLSPALSALPPRRWRPARAPPRGRLRQLFRHGSSSMFARESDAVFPRLGRCTILVCAAGTSRVTCRGSRVLERSLDVVAIGARSCASASQWCVRQPRLVCLGVAWRHRSSRSSNSSSSGGGGGGNDLNSEQLLQGVHVSWESCRSRLRLRRELARRSARRCVSAVATATAAAAAAARAARPARTR